MTHNSQHQTYQMTHPWALCSVNIGLDPPSESEICSLDGGFNHNSSDVEKTTHWNSDSEEGFLDLEGDELLLG